MNLTRLAIPPGRGYCRDTAGAPDGRCRSCVFAYPDDSGTCKSSIQINTGWRAAAPEEVDPKSSSRRKMCFAACPVSPRWNRARPAELPASACSLPLTPICNGHWSRLSIASTRFHVIRRCHRATNLCWSGSGSYGNRLVCIIGVARK